MDFQQWNSFPLRNSQISSETRLQVPLPLPARSSYPNKARKPATTELGSWKCQKQTRGPTEVSKTVGYRLMFSWPKGNPSNLRSHSTWQVSIDWSSTLWEELGNPKRLWPWPKKMRCATTWGFHAGKTDRNFEGHAGPRQNNINLLYHQDQLWSI